MRKSATICWLVLGLWLAGGLPASEVFAGDLCVDPFSEAGARHGVPASLLRAIAEVESGAKAMALNVAGRRQEARTPSEVAVRARRAMAEGKSFDVCMMQINVQHFRGKDPGEMLRLDRCVEAAAKLLGSLLKEHGSVYEAVKRYHSPDAEKGRNYAGKVLSKWNKNKGSEVCLDWAYGAEGMIAGESGRSGGSVAVREGSRRHVGLEDVVKGEERFRLVTP